tara:strand:- start:78 stop:293 length:216 start_codon:yes stop_codon:yes gene_type:complete
MISYYPKSGRCRACVKLHDDCSALPFHTMPIHSQDGTDAVVICSEYVKSANAIPSKTPTVAPPKSQLNCEK